MKSKEEIRQHYEFFCRQLRPVLQYSENKKILRGDAYEKWLNAYCLAWVLEIPKSQFHKDIEGKE